MVPARSALVPDGRGRLGSRGQRSEAPSVASPRSRVDSQRWHSLRSVAARGWPSGAGLSPRPVPLEPWVAHLSRLPASLDADLRRISDAEGVSLADLERAWLRAMVAFYDEGHREPQPDQNTLNGGQPTPMSS